MNNPHTPVRGRGATFLLLTWLMTALLTGLGLTTLVLVTGSAVGNAVGPPFLVLPPEESDTTGPEESGTTGATDWETTTGGDTGPISPRTPTFDDPPVRTYTPPPTTRTPVLGFYSVYQNTATMVLGSYEKNKYTYDEARAQAFSEFPGGGFDIIDTAYYPAMTPGYWAAVHGSYSSESAASADCPRFGRTAGPYCYGRYTG